MVADEELLLYTVCYSGQSPFVIVTVFKVIVICKSLIEAYPLVQVYSKKLQIELTSLAGALRVSILAAPEGGRVPDDGCYSQVPEAAV